MVAAGVVALAAATLSATPALASGPAAGNGATAADGSATPAARSASTVSTVVAAAPEPATPKFGRDIESYSAYEPGTTCTLVDRPGALKFAQLIRDTYGQNQSIGISYNACYTISEHNEGRAVDWMLDSTNPKDVAKAKAMFKWLFATDQYGNTDAMARRLGIMYIIWNHHMWRAYEGGVWGPYNGTNPHTDHIHFSFNLDGATGRTSFWTGHPLPGPCEAAPVSKPVPALPVDPMTFVPVTATRVVATPTGRGTVGGDACRLFAPIEYESIPTRLDATVTGVGDVPATGVSAVLLHVTMQSPNSESSLRIGPAGQPLPKAARVTAPLNGTASSMVVVPVGADGKVSFTTSAGATDVVADVVGYYPSPSVAARRTGTSGELYKPLTAWNVLNPTTLVPARSTDRLVVAGSNGVPAGATAVVVNVSVGTSRGSGHLFAYPAGADRPRSPLLSYLPRHVTTIQTVLPVGANGSIVIDNAGRRAKPVWVDVVGAYVPTSSAGALGLVARSSVVPVANSKKSIGITTLNSGDTKLLALGRHLPPQARAVVLNVTVAKPAQDTRLTFWRADQPMPGTVDMSASTGRTVTSSFIVPLSVAQKIKLSNSGADGVNVVIRLAGYLA